MNFLQAPASNKIDLSRLGIPHLEISECTKFGDIVRAIVDVRASNPDNLSAEKPAERHGFSVAMALRSAIAQQCSLSIDEEDDARESALRSLDATIKTFQEKKDQSISKKQKDKYISNLRAQENEWIESEKAARVHRKTMELTTIILDESNISLVGFAEEDRLKEHLEALLLTNSSASTPVGSSRQ